MSRPRPPFSHDPDVEALHEPLERRVRTDQGAEVQRIGDILRRVREHRRESVEFISEHLRIRPSYLIALEGSQYEDLPADAYVIGFLRSYALYLGLDGRGAIDQYRREMAGRRRKPQLSMPQPLSEGRGPSFALFAGAALAVCLVYGLWYGLSSPDKAALEAPVPFPASLPPPAMAATSLPITPLVVVAAPEESVAKAPEDAPPLPAPAAPLATTKEKAAQGSVAEGAVPHKEEAPVYGAKEAGGLSLLAEQESWVLVTNAQGETVFERTLKAGERYNVPAGKTLNLTTGNAAALRFFTTGGELPSLGASAGKVLRAVPLDPEKLKTYLSTKGAAPKPAAFKTQEERDQ